jgi:hypothetical protein
MINLARLLPQLQNTSLQQKDNALYQVIRDLILNLIQQQDIINSFAFSSGSGSSGLQGPQGLPGSNSSIIYDGFNSDEQWVIPASFDRLILQMLSVDSPTFFVDNINHRVGIGTITPDRTLRIDGASPVVQVNGTLNTGESVFFFTNDAGKYVQFIMEGSAAVGTLAGLTKANLGWIEANGSALLIDTNGALPIVFGINRIEIARISSTGNVGIGSTAPLALLSVGGNGSASYTADVTGTAHISTSLFTPLVLGGTTNSSMLTLQSTSGVGTVDFINFLVGNNGAIEVMRMLTTGFVGIGTTIPQELLHLQRTGGATYGSGSQLRIDSHSSGKRCEIHFTDNVTVDAFISLLPSATPASNWLSLSARGTESDFVIVGNGNVGIGLTGATAGLHIKAGTASAGTAPLKLTSGTLLTAPEAGVIEFLTDKYYGTQTTGPTRKAFAMVDTAAINTSGIMAKIDTAGLTANVGASTLFVVPSTGEGLYRISAYVVETVAGSVTSNLPNVQIIYTDKDSNVSITIDATPVLGVAGIGQTGALNANTVGTASSGVIVIYVKASTTIQYQTVNYASNLAGMTYALHIRLELM